LDQVGALDFDEVSVGLDFEATRLEGPGGLEHGGIAVPWVVKGAAHQMSHLSLSTHFSAIDVDHEVGFERLVGEASHYGGVKQAGPAGEQQQDGKDEPAFLGAHFLVR